MIERCADRADARADVMVGTAFPAARLLLVEQPFPWGSEGLRTSRFDRETALAVEARGREVGVRVQAIRGLGRHVGTPRRRWASVDTRTAQVRWGEFESDSDLLDIPLDGSVGMLDADPLYLVCTHGRHDACCAGRGRPLIKRLAELRPGRVWQTSHLGGCRFAPTVLVLPHGVMYGRVPSTAADDLVAAAEAGEVRSAWMRGRIGIPPAAQTAMVHAHEALGLPRVRDVAFRSLEAADAGSVLVHLDTARGPYAVTVTRTRVDAVGLTCGAPGPSWFVAHRAVALQPG